MFFAWNIRGLNNARRHTMVKEWIRTHRPFFGAYLETHIQPTNSSRISSAIPVGWNYFANWDHHATARIVVVWDPRVTMTIYHASAQAVTCGVFILSENATFTVTFAYGFNQPEGRQLLWDELAQLNSSTPVARCPWAVVGDFNQILRTSHHSNQHDLEVDIAGMDVFNLALQEAELFEAHTKGLPFTWNNNQDDNPISKKIDHALFNASWAQNYPDSFCEFLDPDQSDHAPALISMPSIQRRVVKPFKYFHHVADHPQFIDSVGEAWNCEAITGSLQFKLARSLKLQKPILRRLNRTHFSGISNRVKEQYGKLSVLKRQLLINPDPDTARREHEERAIWHRLISAEEKFYRQKSRVRWNCLGDRDTAFYHKYAVQRAHINHIHFLRDEDDRLIGTSEEIKAHAVDFFESILGSADAIDSPCSVDSLRNLLPFRCSEEQRLVLQSEVTVEEVTKTIFAMPLDKSPGPDGFSVEFIRSSWSIVGPDIIGAVREFFRNGRLLKDFNNTALVLIPKTSEACKLGDFRPISCCNLMYKIISKIIANRLKPILKDCISPNQAAFLKGRSLGENVLLSSELIRNYNKANCPRSSMIKVDIRKAFDSVNWDFLLKVLEAQEFPPLFRSWIKECVCSTRFSIAINGELAGFFEGKKGLRQGDSISPYLFLLVMEALSKLLEQAADRDQLRLHPMCSEPRLTHLLFADDLLVFSDGSRHSLSGITSVMKEFKKMSGLEMNPSKSEIFFGGFLDIEAQVLSDLFGIKRGTFPTKYLGLPLNPSRISMDTLQPFLEKITSKLHSWTVKLLSFAGKIRLVSSEIYGMVNFWSAVFNLPKSFYAKVDSLCAAFLWRNKTTSASSSRVAWKDVCKPKVEGGLGIRLLEDHQMVFRLKQVWNFFSNPDSLLVDWLNKNVFKRRSFWVITDSARLSPNVRSMLQLRDALPEYLHCIVRNGARASFWFDSWTDLGPFISYAGEDGPRGMRIRKDARVIEAVRNDAWFLPAARCQEMVTIQTAITSVPPPHHANGNDEYLWRQANGSFRPNFSSKDTWEHLRDRSPPVYWNRVVWFKEHIPRNSFMSWLALLRRLPTKDRLRRWGINVPEVCVLCSAETENHHHLFFECEFSSSIWLPFASQVWPNPPNDLHSAAAWINFSTARMGPVATSVLKLHFQSTIYLLWKERNARIFSAVSSSPASIRVRLDRLMRDRLLSLPVRWSTSPSLLQFYFACTRPP